MMPFVMPFAMEGMQGMQGMQGMHRLSSSSPERLVAAGSKAYVDACVAMGIRPDLKILSNIIAQGTPTAQASIRICQYIVTL
jgi:hypothetical protein